MIKGAANDGRDEALEWLALDRTLARVKPAAAGNAGATEIDLEA